MQTAQVRLDNIGKRYGDLWAARDVNLNIGAGEFFTLLGPSGCGKTTLLRMIAGFVAPDEGTIFFDDRAVNDVPPWRRDVGMVFQNYALWPHLTAFENVAFGLRERKLARSEIKAKVGAALERVGLRATEQRRPSQLSGGQQQRVALARTLVIQPRVLLLDEPLSNLDAKLRGELCIELLKLQRDLGITTVYVTHDQEEALALSTRIAVMQAGKIVQEGSPHEIYESPRSRFVAEFVGKSNLFRGTVKHVAGQTFEIETDEGFKLEVGLGALHPEATPGKKITIYIRPEVMVLAPTNDGRSGANRLVGKLAASAYHGASVEYEIDIAGKSIRARSTQPKGKLAFSRGDNVAVLFDPNDIGCVTETDET